MLDSATRPNPALSKRSESPYVKAPGARLAWTAYNHQHLLVVIEHMDRGKLGAPCRIGGGEAVSLGFVVMDYVATWSIT